MENASKLTHSASISLFQSMRLLLLQHDPLDGPGALSDWATARGNSVAICLICQGEHLPPLDSFDLLVSLGGPMGAYEEQKHPWLATEKEYLRQALTAGKKILGLCLGCQLLADALGGTAFRHTCKEFGWQPIEPLEAGKGWFGTGDSFSTTENDEKGIFYAFQWHGDTYSLPQGAIQLARNDAAEQQAFLIEAPGGGKVLGLQFHLEWTEQMAWEALAEPGVAPPPSPSVQTPEEILSDLSLFHTARSRFFALMDRLAAD
jgi:GMP synthase-like glutamine amidotransferase